MDSVVKESSLEKSGGERASRKAVRRISWQRRWVYAICRIPVMLFFLIFYRTRYFGQNNIPKEGALLIVSNHQSNYDPPLIGSGISRRINYLARKTLFKFKPFAWLIDMFDAIPLDNAGIGYEGIKETIKRLKNGEAVLMFPEGARTWDGKIAPFKEGFLTLAMRGKASILPVAIAGVFETWPRFDKYPGAGRFKIVYGEPIPYEIAKDMDPSELHKLVESRIHELYDSIAPREKR